MSKKIVRTDKNQTEWEAGGLAELPWKVGKRDKTAVLNARGTHVICDTYTKENAAFIVEAANAHVRGGSLTIHSPGITFKKPIKLPHWKLELILDIVHMNDEKLSFVSHYRIAAVFKKTLVHKCPKDLNPKTERCNMPGHPIRK